MMKPTTALFAAIGVAAFAAAFLSPTLSGQAPTAACAGARDLRLINGNIVTMDARGRTVREVTIQDGRFTAVGPRGSGQRLSACTQTIDCGGPTHASTRSEYSPATAVVGWR